MAADIEGNYPLHDLEHWLERRDVGRCPVDGNEVELRRCRYCQRDDAAGRLIVVGEPYTMIRLGRVLRMMVDRRTVRMPVISVMVGSAMDVKRLSLRLQ